MAIEIPLNGGLVTQADAEEVGANACTVLENLEFDKFGLLYKRLGRGAPQEIPDMDITQVSRWVGPDGTTYWILIDVDGVIAASTTLSTFTTLIEDYIGSRVQNYGSMLRFSSNSALSKSPQVYQYIDRDFFWSGDTPTGVPGFYIDIARPRDVITAHTNPVFTSNSLWFFGDTTGNGTSDDNFVPELDLNANSYFYKYSLVFDGNQESPLSELVGDTSGSAITTAIPSLELKIDTGDSLVNWNKRVTGINIYRATGYASAFKKIATIGTKSDDTNIIKVTDAEKGKHIYIPGANYTTNEHLGRKLNTLLPPKAGYDFSIDDVTDWSRAVDTFPAVSRNVDSTYSSSGDNSLKLTIPNPYSQTSGWNDWGKIYLVKNETYSISFKAIHDIPDPYLWRCAFHITGPVGSDVRVQFIDNWQVDGGAPTTYSYDGFDWNQISNDSFQTWTASFTFSGDTGEYWFSISHLLQSGVAGSSLYIDEFFFNKQYSITANTSEILTLSEAHKTRLWGNTHWSITDAAQTTFYDGGLGNTEKAYGGESVIASDTLALGKLDSHKGFVYQKGSAGLATSEVGWITKNVQKAIQVHDLDAFPYNDGAAGNILTISPNYYWSKNANEQTLRFFDKGTTDGVEHPTGETSLEVNFKHSINLEGRQYVADIALNPSTDNETHKDWVLFSELNQPDVIPISNYISIPDLQGGEIVGLGKLIGDLVVFQTKGIYRLSIPSADPGSWSLSESEPNIGCVATDSIVEYEGGIFFAGNDNFYHLGSNFQATPITTSIKDVYQSTPNLSSTRAVIDGKKNRLLCKFGSVKTEIYALDLLKFRFGKEHWSKILTPNDAVNNSYTTNLFAVGEDGDVHTVNSSLPSRMSYLVPSNPSENVSWKRTTGWISTPDMDRSVVLRRLNLRYKSGDSITAKIYTDEDSATVVKELTIPENITDTTKKEWYKCKPSVRCRTFMIELSNSTSSSNSVEIRKLEVEFG